MKRLIAAITVLMLMGLSAVAENEVAEDWTMPDEVDDAWNADAVVEGEWEICELSEARVDKTLKATLERAVSEMAGVSYTPVGLLATQTASGTNYCILCRCAYVATETGETGWCLVYLSQSLDGEAEVTNVVNLDIADLADYGIFH